MARASRSLPSPCPEPPEPLDATLRPTRPLPLLACLLTLLADGPAAQQRAGGDRIIGQRMRRTLQLADLAGTPHELFPHAEKKRRTVVLVFWSLRDPVSRRYVTKLEDLRRRYAKDGVDLYLVASNHDEIGSLLPDPYRELREYARSVELGLPLLLDHGNVLADRVKALSANHAFVVGRDLYVKYAGAIDDDPHGEREEAGHDLRSWLSDAIEATLRGEPVEPTLTRPVGHPIKRAPAEPRKAG